MKYEVTDASVYDSQVLENLLDKNDSHEDFYRDSVYRGKKQQDSISQKEMIDKTCKKGYKNSPLTDQDNVYKVYNDLICNNIAKITSQNMKI